MKLVLAKKERKMLTWAKMFNVHVWAWLHFFAQFYEFDMNSRGLKFMMSANLFTEMGLFYQLTLNKAKFIQRLEFNVRWKTLCSRENFSFSISHHYLLNFTFSSSFPIQDYRCSNFAFNFYQFNLLLFDFCIISSWLLFGLNGKFFVD